MLGLSEWSSGRDADRRESVKGPSYVRKVKGSLPGVVVTKLERVGKSDKYSTARPDEVESATVIVTFNDLPGEVLVGVFAYLSARELLVVAQLNKWISSLSANSSVWERLYYRDFVVVSKAPIPKGNNVNPTLSRSSWNRHHHSPSNYPIHRIIQRHSNSSAPEVQHDGTFKSAYLDQTREMCARKIIRMEAQRKVKAQKDAQARILRTQRIMFVVNAQVPTLALSFCPVTFVALLHAHILDPGRIPIGVVFVPYHVLLATALVSWVVSYISYTQRDSSQAVLYGVWDRTPSMLKHLSNKADVADLLPHFLSGLVLCACLEIFGILVSLMPIAQGISWSVAFAPLWFMLVTLVTAHLVELKRVDKDDGTAMRLLAFGLVTTLLVLASAVVIALYLDGILVASLEVVLVPIWLLNAMWVCLPAVSHAARCYRDGRASADVGELFVVWLFLSPILAFEIKLCQYMYGTTSLSSVFAPLYVWMSILALFGLIDVFYLDFSRENEHTRQHWSSWNEMENLPSSGRGPHSRRNTTAPQFLVRGTRPDDTPAAASAADISQGAGAEESGDASSAWQDWDPPGSFLSTFSTTEIPSGDATSSSPDALTANDLEIALATFLADRMGREDLPQIEEVGSAVAESAAAVSAMESQELDELSALALEMT